MKILLIAGAFLLSASIVPTRSEYDVIAIYKGIETDDGVKAVVDDEIEEVDFLLAPLSLENGKYVIHVSRQSKDLYKVDGKNIYIQTRYCYEYSHGEEVVLTLQGWGRYTTGKLIFD